MKEVHIIIREMTFNDETAVRIAKCLKKHEPEIWNILSDELKNAVSKSDEHDTPCYMAECITCGYRTEVKSGKKAICGKCDTTMIIHSDF